MIISRAPFRISFVGGGSDMEEFYSKQSGSVLCTSINKYVYISSHPYFRPDQTLLKYSSMELIDDIHHINHPIFKEVFQEFNCSGGIEINSSADVPAGTGLGSSSAFTVALLHNFYARNGEYAQKDTLANLACNIEINRLNSPIGKQDQFASAFGGINRLTFQPNGMVTVTPIFLSPDVLKEIENNLLMFFTGNTRSASSILSHQKKAVRHADKQIILSEMVDLVDQLETCLVKEDLDQFGVILNQNWELKKQLTSSISNDEINAMYETALNNGAIGGKLLGAGGGGFLLFYCPKSQQSKLRSALSNLQELTFNFEFEGAKVVHIENE